jgi:hypothetical protein
MDWWLGGAPGRRGREGPAAPGKGQCDERSCPDLDRVHAVRVLRGLAALLLWLVATLLLVVAVILSITVVLLPIGLLLGFLALRLYRLGLGLVLPRKRDVARGVRKEVQEQVGRWRKRSHALGLDRPVTTARKKTRTVGKMSRTALRRISR